MRGSEYNIELPFDGIPRALQTAVADGINEFRAKEERFTFLIEKVLPATSKHKTPRGSAGKPVTLQGEKEISMRTTFLTMGALALSLVGTGCVATHKYVAKTVTPVEQRVSGTEAKNTDQDKQLS